MRIRYGCRVLIVLAVPLALSTLGGAPPATSQARSPSEATAHDSINEFEKAVQAARQQYGDHDVRYAEALLSAVSLAPIYQPRASIERAIETAQAIFEKVKGPNSVPVARSLLVLASHYMKPAPWNPDREQDSPKARQLIERALGIYEANGLAESDQAARAIEQLGRLEQHVGNAGAAEALFERSLRTIEKTAGPDHPQVVGVLYRLQAIYRMQKRFEGVEPLYKRIISIEEATFGQSDLRTITAWDGLADYYRSRCRDTEADAIEKRTSSDKARKLSAYLTEIAKAPDATHPALALKFKTLGDHYRRMGQWADAESAYQRAVDFLEKERNRWDLWQARAGLAESYLRQGRVGEAGREYLLAVDDFRSHDGGKDAAGKDKLLPLEVLEGLAAVYESTSRQEEAAVLKTQAAAGRQRMRAARNCP
jgi:tetratricopeptide (TPR) repeat protein